MILLCVLWCWVWFSLCGVFWTVCFHGRTGTCSRKSQSSSSWSLRCWAWRGTWKWLWPPDSPLLWVCACKNTHKPTAHVIHTHTHTQRPLTKKRVRRKWDVFTTWLNLIVSKLIVRVTKTTMTSLRIIFLPFCITGFLSSCETPHRPVKTTAADQLGGQFPAGQNKDSPTDLRPCNSADIMIKYS